MRLLDRPVRRGVEFEVGPPERAPSGVGVPNDGRQSLLLEGPSLSRALLLSRVARPSFAWAGAADGRTLTAGKIPVCSLFRAVHCDSISTGTCFTSGSDESCSKPDITLLWFVLSYPRSYACFKPSMSILSI